MAINGLMLFFVCFFFSVWEVQDRLVYNGAGHKPEHLPA